VRPHRHAAIRAAARLDYVRKLSKKYSARITVCLLSESELRDVARSSTWRKPVAVAEGDDGRLKNPKGHPNAPQELMSHPKVQA